MGKTSTLIYLYSNFEESELIYEGYFDKELNKYKDAFSFLEVNTKKVPDRIVDQVIDFAKSYS